MSAIRLTLVVERKRAELPPYVVVPAQAIAAWKLEATTTIEGTIDGAELGRRSIKRWDAERWFIELRKEHLTSIRKSAGDRVALVLRMASAALPEELQALIDTDKAARARWEGCTDAQQRMMRESILAAKTSAARERRARSALLPPEKPKPPRVTGIPSTPTKIQVKVIGRRLPGRVCGPYSDISVGLPQKVGCDPAELVAADVREAKWETTIQVYQRDGVPMFRGPAVNGPPGERFLYLTWIGRKGRKAPAMFRRAKLRLDAVPAKVLLESLDSGQLVGRLNLTASDGMPVCASVRPPELEWKSS